MDKKMGRITESLTVHLVPEDAVTDAFVSHALQERSLFAEKEDHWESLIAILSQHTPRTVGLSTPLKANRTAEPNPQLR